MVYKVFQRNLPLNSLEAKHLILVWIMKVKGPKNQTDFIKVLYKRLLLQGTGPPKDEIYI